MTETLQLDQNCQIAEDEEAIALQAQDEELDDSQPEELTMDDAPMNVLETELVDNEDEPEENTEANAAKVAQRFTPKTRAHMRSSRASARKYSGHSPIRRPESSVVMLTGDPVRMYLRQIGSYALLSASEEVDLAIKIQAGNMATQKLEACEAGVVELTRAERRRLMRVEQVGLEAKQALINANLRLTVSIAKRYVGRGLLLLDLIQEGNLGLIRAVEKFDYTMGNKFSTYATWWIKQAVSRALADQSRVIRVPVHMVETINKLTRVQRQLLQDLGREPTQEEIGKEMGITADKVREIQKIAQEPVSLETPIGEEEDSQLCDFIEDEEALAPVDAAVSAAMSESIDQALDTLPERDRRVIRLRFGLEDGTPRTLAEVGQELGVTRERIRQIESKTLARLRQECRVRGLREFWSE